MLWLWFWFRKTILFNNSIITITISIVLSLFVVFVHSPAALLCKKCLIILGLATVATFLIESSSSYWQIGSIWQLVDIWLVKLKLNRFKVNIYIYFFKSRFCQNNPVSSYLNKKIIIQAKFEITAIYLKK